jgi:hypothetical protein
MMGTDAGQEDEAPAHRVFVDAFELAVFPVTRAEYEAFVRATRHELPRDWADPSFSKPDLPVVGVSWNDAVAYCAWRGSLRRAETGMDGFRGATGRLIGFRTRRRVRWTGPGPSHSASRMDSDYTGSRRTFTSGAPIGTTRTITACRRSGTRAGRIEACGARRAVARGGMR